MWIVRKKKCFWTVFPELLQNITSYEKTARNKYSLEVEALSLQQGKTIQFYYKMYEILSMWLKNLGLLFKTWK